MVIVIWIEKRVAGQVGYFDNAWRINFLIDTFAPRSLKAPLTISASLLGAGFCIGGVYVWLRLWIWHLEELLLLGDVAWLGSTITCPVLFLAVVVAGFLIHWMFFGKNPPG
jgi:hypothetical protein